jgi:Histidine phosphatase superfamily (branch 2)
VYAGELTSSGMRQRFLLGTLNRERYVNEYELLSRKEEVYVQTTTYDRTFQSGFSELMGFFPPGTL